MTLLPLGCDAVDDLAAGYVLGALEPDEVAAVRAHLAACDRPHLELAELGGVVPYLALAADPIEPRDAVRARVLDGLRQEAGGQSKPVQVAAPPTRPSRPARSAAGRGWPRLGRPALALAAAVIVALGATSAFLAIRLGESQAYAQQAARAAEIAAETGSRSVAISPAAGTGPSGTAVLGADGRGVVLVNGLAPVNGAQVYEVWLIAAGTARPVPAGALRVTSDGRGWLDDLGTVPPGPITVALTREAGPGATTPTLPILASGT